MYWTLKSIPELRPLLPSERKRLWHAATLDRFRAADLLILLMILAGAWATVMAQDALETAAGKPLAEAMSLAALLGYYPLHVFPLLAARNRPVLRRPIAQGR